MVSREKKEGVTRTLLRGVYRKNYGNKILHIHSVLNTSGKDGKKLLPWTLFDKPSRIHKYYLQSF